MSVWESVVELWDQLQVSWQYLECLHSSPSTPQWQKSMWLCVCRDRHYCTKVAILRPSNRWGCSLTLVGWSRHHSAGLQLWREVVLVLISPGTCCFLSDHHPSSGHVFTASLTLSVSLHIITSLYWSLTAHSGLTRHVVLQNWLTSRQMTDIYTDLTSINATVIYWNVNNTEMWWHKFDMNINKL